MILSVVFRLRQQVLRKVVISVSEEHIIAIFRAEVIIQNNTVKQDRHKNVTPLQSQK